MAEETLPHFVYWIYDETCICPRLHGYVGITCDVKRRVKTHYKRFGTRVCHAVLFDGTLTECRIKEYELRPDFNIGWNLSTGGRNRWSPEQKKRLAAIKRGVPRSAETKEKLRLANLGKRHTEEAKAKVRASLIGNRRSANFSIETRKRISDARKGKPLSPEHIEKLRQAHLGSKRSEETRRNISQALIGHRFSEATKRKMSRSAKRRFANMTPEQLHEWGGNTRGFRMSAETKVKMSLAAKGKKKSNATRRRMSVAQRKRFANHSATTGE